MKADFKNIINIYNNSNDIEKLIFKDVINDMIKGVFQMKKAKKIPQSIYIEKIAKDTIKDMNFQSVKEYNTFISDLRTMIYKGIDIKNKVSGVFNVTKPRSLFPKNIKEYYHTIGDEEIEIIQDYRKLLLKNLEEYGFIEIYVSKNKEYHKLCEKFMNSITKIDNKNKRIYLGLSNIKDKNIRNHLARLEVDFGVEKINKAFNHLFNDMKLENYLCKKEDLELLYSKITGKKLPNNYVEFFTKEGILTYNGKNIIFNIGEKPYLMLEKIFLNKNKDIGIDKIDLYKYIENSDSIELYYKNKSIINDLKNGINRRFKKEFTTDKLFLRFKDSALYRDI